MADATLADLRNRALQKLHVLQAGEAANAEDTALVQGVIVSVHEKLRDMEICWWSDSAIPQAVLEDLALYVACHCAADFMSAADAAAYSDAHEMKAETKLRRLSATRERVDLPTRATYF